MSDLFRKEVLDHAQQRLSGEVILATPVTFRILAILVASVITAGAVFLGTATFARKERVSGWVTPDAGLIRLMARQGGTVQALHVKEGDLVAVGQPIATLGLSSQITGGDASAALKASLAAQLGAASTRGVAALAALDQERRNLEVRRSSLELELAETRTQSALQIQRVTLAEAEVARAESIAAQGFLPRREVELRRSAALAEAQSLSQLNGVTLAKQREIEETRARLREIPIEVRAATAEATSITAGLDKQQTETEAQSSYVVVASTAGRIAALPFQQGQSVPLNATAAILSPAGSRLEAELYAPSSAIGFIRPGQKVRLMYAAFPFQKFGSGEGVVTSVSRTGLAPGEVSIPGLEVQEAVFRIRARLARDSVPAYGEDVPLQPGMLLSAEIVIDRRNLLEWLLDPLYAAGRR